MERIAVVVLTCNCVTKPKKPSYAPLHHAVCWLWLSYKTLKVCNFLQMGKYTLGKVQHSVVWASCLLCCHPLPLKRLLSAPTVSWSFHCWRRLVLTQAMHSFLCPCPSYRGGWISLLTQLIPSASEKRTIASFPLDHWMLNIFLDEYFTTKTRKTIAWDIVELLQSTFRTIFMLFLCYLHLKICWKSVTNVQ